MRYRRAVFEYDNYREFLKDAYEYSKTLNKNFSFRYFSKTAGFKSPNILKLVIDGERNIAPDSIEKFTKAFKLNKEESVFFRNLVLLNQAKTSSEKQGYAEEILKLKSYRRSHPLKDSQYQYFSKWYYVTIRDMVDLRGFKEDYEWISEQLRPYVSVAEARNAVEQLLKLGLLARDQNGRLVQMNKNVTTPDEVASAFVAGVHRELMRLASLSIDTIPRQMRDISSVSMSVSEKNASRIKELIQKFRKEIIDLAAQDEDPTRIYQLNMQFFPMIMTEVHGEKE